MVTQCMPWTPLVGDDNDNINFPAQSSFDFEIQGCPSVSAQERSSFSDGIQEMKYRALAARAFLIRPTAQQGFVAVQDVHVKLSKNEDGTPSDEPHAASAREQIPAASQRIWG